MHLHHNPICDANQYINTGNRNEPKEEILNNKEDNYLKRSCLYSRYSKMMPIYSTN